MKEAMLQEVIPYQQGRSLAGRDFLRLAEFTTEELEQILALARELKAKQERGEPHPYLAGKTLAMLFRKTSTRTRVSFEVGMFQLGGHALYLNAAESQLGIGESIEDTGQVLSQYVDGIMIRTYAQREVEELAAAASVPVINGLSDEFHPCQALADYFTLRELFGELRGLPVTFVGDGNNVCHSLIEGAVRFGVHLTAATPPGYEPAAEVVNWAKREAVQTGAVIRLTHDPLEAVEGAQVVYTDTWTSMGQEAQKERRRKDFQGYQVNEELLGRAGKQAVVMHCLPAHHGEEITHEVAYGPRSVIFLQAGNRLHVQKALLTLLLGRVE